MADIDTEKLNWASARGRSGRSAVSLLLGITVVACAVGGLVGWNQWTATSTGTGAAARHFTVRRGTFPIVVMERGALESQVNTNINCQVSNVPNDGVRGAMITYLAPNGSAVKKGDLVVEYESAFIKEILFDQAVLTEEARAEMIQANVQFENQKTQNETFLEKAELDVLLARMKLEMYTDKEDGDLHIKLIELRLSIEEAQNTILESQASLEAKEIEHTGIKTLHSLGYRGQGSLRQAFLDYLRSQNSMVGSHNKLSNLKSSYDNLLNYEGPMEVKKLEGALETAERSLAQVRRDNEALLASAKAKKIGADRAFAKEQERLNFYEEQIDKCKVFAPHDGMVVYSYDRREDRVMYEGAVVYELQSIMSLPDLSVMQVTTRIHESVLENVKPGMSAEITLDAFPEITYTGTVESVNLVPDSGGWSDSGVKVYRAVIKIEEEVTGLRPGMTAIVHIDSGSVQDSLVIPPTALFNQDRDSWCFVRAGRGYEKRKISVGRSSDNWVAVNDGLRQGEQVVLNPERINELTFGGSQGSIAPDRNPGRQLMP